METLGILTTAHWSYETTHIFNSQCVTVYRDITQNIYGIFNKQKSKCSKKYEKSSPPPTNIVNLMKILLLPSFHIRFMPLLQTLSLSLAENEMQVELNKTSKEINNR